MQDACGNRLVQLQVIHRHGARSPEHGHSFPSICGAAAFRTFFTFTPILPRIPLYPSTPRAFDTSGEASCYKGQLTPLGAAQMFALGARLRARYAGFMPERYDAKIVAVRSTAMRRTVESAMAMLSGLFPARERGELQRQVKVEVRGREDETMLGFRRACNRLFDLQMMVHGAFTWGGMLKEEVEGVLGEIENKTESQRVIMMRDIAVALRENGCEPAGWEGVAQGMAEGQILRLYGRESWGISLGRFAEELLDNAEKYNDIGWRVKLYSGHDTTLLPLMGCFEDKIRGIPQFAADMVLETWLSTQAHSEPMVRLRYEGEGVVIKGCEEFGDLCPVSVVRKAVRERVPRDLEKACRGRKEDRTRKAEKSMPAGTTVVEGATF